MVKKTQKMFFPLKNIIKKEKRDENTKTRHIKGTINSLFIHSKYKYKTDNYIYNNKIFLSTKFIIKKKYNYNTIIKNV